MHYPTTLAALATLLLASITTAQESNYAQVNFYYDKACQDYAGSEYPASGVVTGGPYGSQAIIWVDAGGPYCCEVSGYLQACKNAACSASDTVSAGQCKSFNNGMWAEWNCIDCAGK